jgi:hypothetical protein
MCDFVSAAVTVSSVTLSLSQSLPHLWPCPCLDTALSMTLSQPQSSPNCNSVSASVTASSVTLSLSLNSNSVSTSDHCLVHMWLCLGLGHCLVCDSVYATVTAWAVTLSLPQSLPHMWPCLCLSHRLIYDSVTASSVTLFLSQSLPHLWLCLCPRRCINCDSVSPAVCLSSSLFISLYFLPMYVEVYSSFFACPVLTYVFSVRNATSYTAQWRCWLMPCVREILQTKTNTLVRPGWPENLFHALAVESFGGVKLSVGYFLGMSLTRISTGLRALILRPG